MGCAYAHLWDAKRFDRFEKWPRVPGAGSVEQGLSCVEAEWHFSGGGPGYRLEGLPRPGTCVTACCMWWPPRDVKVQFGGGYLCFMLMQFWLYRWAPGYPGLQIILVSRKDYWYTNIHTLVFDSCHSPGTIHQYTE